LALFRLADLLSGLLAVLVRFAILVSLAILVFLSILLFFLIVLRFLVLLLLSLGFGLSRSFFFLTFRFGNWIFFRFDFFSRSASFLSLFVSLSFGCLFSHLCCKFGGLFSGFCVCWIGGC
jgi:hypothetical protein